MYNPRIDLPTPVCYCPIRGSGPIYAIAVSADSKWIASGDWDGFVQLWDSGSYQAIGNAGKHDAMVLSLCFSPDSRWLVSGSKDKSVRMWDCGTAQAIGSLMGHLKWRHTSAHRGPIDAGGMVFAVALSNGHIAAGVGNDVCIFDIETRQRIASMKGHCNFVWTVGFSPNGGRIASGSADTTIRIWDVQTGKQTHRLNRHADSVRSVAFSPNSKWIASASEDKIVRVWCFHSGQPIVPPLTGHTSWVASVTFSTNGYQIISGSYDCTIRIWPAPHEHQQITAIHLSQRPASTPAGRIQLEGPLWTVVAANHKYQIGWLVSTRQSGSC
jgi:WD40 repeat protein